MPLWDPPPAILKDIPYFSYAYVASLLSNCLKVKVGAVLIKDGKVIGVGYNDAKPKANYCPRKDMQTGENYFLCSTHCSQVFHAETMMLYHREVEDCRGSDVYIYGHDKVCAQCYEAMKYYGIKKIFLMKSGKDLECMEMAL